MFSFTKHVAGPRRQALNDNRIIEMQTKKFRVINFVQGMRESLAITPLAFEAFVAVSDAPGHRDAAEELRWHSVLNSFRTTQRNNSTEVAIWEINVSDPDGVLRSKTIKALAGPDDNDELCITFMLPEEAFPYEIGAPTIMGGTIMKRDA